MRRRRLTSPLSTQRLKGALLALALGTAGGWLFYSLDLPLPWMLGALLACLAAALAGVPVQGPNRIRPAMTLVLGVFLGSAFQPNLVQEARHWWPSLLLLIPYCALLGGLGIPLLIRLGRHDRVTAYFSAMPGGLQEMILAGKEQGGNERAIALIHSLRIVMVVSSLPILLYAMPSIEQSPIHLLNSPWQQWLWLLPAGYVGVLLAQLLRLPAAWFLGPMLASALLHLSQLNSAQLPWLLVAAAQVVIGSCLGARFYGSPWRQLLPWVGQSLVLVVLMMLVCGLFALGCHWAFGLPGLQVFLAFAPGGLAETGLLGLAFDLDVAYISLHHLVRIVLVMLTAPLIFRLWQRWSKAPSQQDQSGG